MAINVTRSVNAALLSTCVDMMFSTEEAERSFQGQILNLVVSSSFLALDAMYREALTAGDNAKVNPKSLYGVVFTMIRRATAERGGSVFPGDREHVARIARTKGDKAKADLVNELFDPKWRKANGIDAKPHARSGAAQTLGVKVCEDTFKNHMATVRKIAGMTDKQVEKAWMAHLTETYGETVNGKGKTKVLTLASLTRTLSSDKPKAEGKAPLTFSQRVENLVAVVSDLQEVTMAIKILEARRDTIMAASGKVPALKTGKAQRVGEETGQVVQLPKRPRSRKAPAVEQVAEVTEQVA